MLGQSQVRASDRGSDDALGAHREFARSSWKVIVITLVDSKLGGDHYRGSTSLEFYKTSLLQIAAQRL
ncbi:hypothetical protein B296_00016661 [Ensete ventricosum]|uniref:Uncharacterized protein n=1 Tax=Ensete ventricosum TaxID=4639 RepID=A0A426YBF4_ENSVE|nr:hypothetical protein B296_00016661 [Ensete ventricosum]